MRQHEKAYHDKKGKIRKIRRAVRLRDTDERTCQIGGGVSDGTIDLLHRVRKHTRLPLALCFEISTPEQAKTCTHSGADGVIVGSAIVDLVERILEYLDVMVRELQYYVKGMEQAIGSPESNLKK